MVSLVQACLNSINLCERLSISHFGKQSQRKHTIFRWKSHVLFNLQNLTTIRATPDHSNVLTGLNPFEAIFNKYSLHLLQYLDNVFTNIGFQLIMILRIVRVNMIFPNHEMDNPRLLKMKQQILEFQLLINYTKQRIMSLDHTQFLSLSKVSRHSNGLS